MTSSSPPFPPGSLLVFYGRDSGGNDQDLSLEQQESVVAAWCREHGYILHHVYKDTRSGSSAVGRAAFEAMLQDLRAPGRDSVPTSDSVPGVAVAGVVVWNWSRFARNIDDAQFHRADLRRRGLEIHSLNDNTPPGAEGRLFEAILDWKNERFLADLSADVTRGLHHLALTHRCAAGPAPVGYRPEPVVIGQRRNGKPHTASRWVIDPEKAPLVRLAFELRAASVTLKEIQRATHLYNNSTGYTYMFRNPIYIGVHIYGREEIHDFTEPIISQPVWDAVQRINRSASRLYRPDRGLPQSSHPRRLGSDYLLSGLVTCAECGKLVSGWTCKSKWGKTYRYYRCNGNHYIGSGRIFACPKASLETAVIAALTTHVLTFDVVLPIQEEYRQQASKDHAAAAALRQDCQVKVAALDERLRRLAEAIAEHGHSPALLRQLGEMEGQKSELLEQLAVLQISSPDHSPEAARRALAQLLQTLAGHDPPRVKTILHSLIQSITVTRHDNADCGSPSITGEITYIIPPLNPSQPIMPMDQNSSQFTLHRHKGTLPFTL